jgi:glycerophosphoryl diester phosphodiesterase
MKTKKLKNIMKSLIGIIIIIYAYLFFSPVLSVRETKQIRSHFNLTAHRCGAGLAPENTLAGIKESLKYNPERIEIDVHQTKDSVIVVIHDNSIDRTTNGKGKIKDMTFEQLLQYNIINNTKEVTDEKIPTLDQIIDAIDGKSKLLIEIKLGAEYYPNIEKRIIKIIEKHNCRVWCIIQSFDIKILTKVHFLDNLIEIHKLYFGKFPFLPIWISNKLEFGSPDDLNYIKEISICNLFATKDAISCIHNSNKKVNVWTVDDINRIYKLINIGVDGVITNHPEIRVQYENDLKNK